MALAFFPFNIIAIINYIFRLYSPYILGCYTTDGLKGITKVNSCAIITFFYFADSGLSPLNFSDQPIRTSLTAKRKWLKARV